MKRQILATGIAAFALAAGLSAARAADEVIIGAAIAQERGEIVFIGGPEQHVGRAADAEPRHVRQIDLCSIGAAHPGQPVDQARHMDRFGHHAAPRDTSSSSRAGSALAHTVILPAPRHTTTSPDCACAITSGASCSSPSIATTWRWP